jgi:hypothetical protein
MARDVHRGIGINQTNLMNDQFESTYALLARSEEKGRGALEILVYAVLILGVVLSIWQFAQTPVKISAPGLEPCVVCHTTTTPQSMLTSRSTPWTGNLEFAGRLPLLAG